MYTLYIMVLHCPAPSSQSTQIYLQTLAFRDWPLSVSVEWGSQSPKLVNPNVLGTGCDGGKPGPLSTEKWGGQRKWGPLSCLSAQCLIMTPDRKKLCCSEEIFLGPSKKSNTKCAMTTSLCGTEEKSFRTCAAGAWVKSACWGFFFFYVFFKRHISGCHDVGLRDAFANSNICLDSRAFFFETLKRTDISFLKKRILKEESISHFSHTKLC